jgi:hypothetical protein
LANDKIHILITNDTPFLDHTDVNVLCGEVVKDAMKGFVWNISAMETLPEYPQWKACKACREIAVKSENEGRQFVIAVLTAGAAKEQ